MLHFGAFNVRTDIFVLFLCIILVLLQVLICFKVKKYAVGLIPSCLFLVLTVILAVSALISDGWDRVGFFILAIIAASLLLACGIGWEIWAVMRRIKRSKL